MLLSVRSHLIAGTAALAVAGAATVAPLPATAGHLGALTTAPVTLTALDTPLQQLLATLNVGQTYLLGSSYSDSGVLNWPNAGFDQTGGDELNFLLTQEASLGVYNAVGILPQLLNQAQPILRQLESNILDYLSTALSGVIDAGIALNAGVWGFPPALIEAAQLAFSGQFGPAFGTVATAITTPITAAATALFDAGAYVLDRVVTRVAAVFSAIPQILGTYVRWAAAGTPLLLEKTTDIANQWIADIGQGDFAAAWNTAVKGLLGPTGLPGLALNLSIGAGVQTGPIDAPEDIEQNFVPSARTAVQATAWTLRGALATQPKAEPAAAVAAAARASVTDTPDAADVRETAVTEASTGAAAAEAAITADAAPAAKAPRAKRAVTRAASTR